MGRPRMSTGAWICTGLICAAVLAPASVYAATLTKTLIAGPGGTNVASVTSQHQLLTTPIGPAQVVRAVKTWSAGCTSVYAPPAGKAIVVTSVVYNYGTGVEGNEEYSGLLDHCGIGGTVYDQIDGVKKYDTLQHTFPTGVPMPSIALSNVGGTVTVFVYGYLIPASSLP